MKKNAYILFLVLGLVLAQSVFVMWCCSNAGALEDCLIKSVVGVLVALACISFYMGYVRKS